MTIHDIRHLFSRPLVVAVATTCATVVALAQQPAAPPVDRAALERQAEINKQPDTPGTGLFAAMKEEVASLPRHVLVLAVQRIGLACLATAAGGRSRGL